MQSISFMTFIYALGTHSGRAPPVYSVPNEHFQKAIAGGTSQPPQIGVLHNDDYFILWHQVFIAYVFVHHWNFSLDMFPYLLPSRTQISSLFHFSVSFEVGYQYFERVDIFWYIYLSGEDYIRGFHIYGRNWLWNCFHHDTCPFQTEITFDGSWVSVFRGLKHWTNAHSSYILSVGEQCSSLYLFLLELDYWPRK